MATLLLSLETLIWIRMLPSGEVMVDGDTGLIMVVDGEATAHGEGGAVMDMADVDTEEDGDGVAVEVGVGVAEAGDGAVDTGVK